MDDVTMTSRSIGKRSQRLDDAIAAAADEMSATIGLPDRIEGGTFEFTFMATQFGGEEPVAFDIRFTWDAGARDATWLHDISGDEGISPGSSAPVWGWASWLNRTDLLLAMTSVDLEMEGWARVPGGAPTIGADADDEEVLADPMHWVALARTIQAVIGEELPAGATSQMYHAEDA